MTNLDNLNKTELQDLLKSLNLYKKLVTKVWNRWKDIFANEKYWKNTLKVEYFSLLDEDYISSEAIKIFEKIFWIKVSKTDIIFVKSDKVLGWMKLYMNDNMIDMSFLKFYNLVK